MQTAKDLKQYKDELKEALENEFQRSAYDKFAVAYPQGRAKAFAGYDTEQLIREVAEAKDAALGMIPELYEEFKKNAEKLGVKVHLAKTAGEANEIIAAIAEQAGVKKIVKSKSMTAEETLLNHLLEAKGLEVTETDLGEWIIQLRHEGPTHMVMPAIHLSREQVKDLFSEVTGKSQTNDIEKLVKVARRELRPKYVEADMGVSGANFAIAETGTIGVITNEGNARLVTTLPRVHVVLAGLDKLCPDLHSALKILKVLPKNATGQSLTSYVTWMTGANACAASTDGKKEMHVVFLDNGRLALAKDPMFGQVLRCVRCGACANVCPVYRLVGGHKMGHIYIGAVGLVLTYFFHGREKAKNLVQNCLNCGACKAVCAAGIDLPAMIKEINARIQDEDGHPLASSLVAKLMKNRSLFHAFLRSASLLQKPVTGGTPYLRHLPMALFKDQEFRALPAVAAKPFRELWSAIKPKVSGARYRVAIFSGCVQDFVYPEQLTAAVKLMARHGVEAEYPMGQNCCGLPLHMMGEKEAAAEIARQNITALDPSGFDYIVCGCASCASFLKHSYQKLLENDPAMAVKAQQFSDRVIDFSSFFHDVLKLTAEDFNSSGEKVAYHAPCHLCRGLGVKKAPRELIAASGYEYAPSDEEEVCCGFGGTFSLKFPELSSVLLGKKLDNVAKTGATTLVTDCPGCVMQLRGGAVKRGMNLKVKHIMEIMADNLK